MLCHFHTRFPPCLLHLFEGEIRANHISKDAEKALDIIGCTTSRMLLGDAIVSIELPPPLSPFKVSHQSMQGLLCEATYAMNGPRKRKLIHQNSIGIVSTDWCNHLFTSR